MEGWKRLGTALGIAAWVGTGSVIGGILSPGTSEWPVWCCVILGALMSILGAGVTFLAAVLVANTADWVSAGFEQDRLRSGRIERQAGALSEARAKGGDLAEVAMLPPPSAPIEWRPVMNSAGERIALISDTVASAKD